MTIKTKLKEYQKTEHKAHFFIKNKLLTLSLFGFISFLFYFAISFKDDGALSAFKEGLEFSTIISTGMVFLFYLYKDHLNSKIAKDIMTNKYMAIFGLGEINRTFLKNREKDEQLPVIIIEKDINSNYIEKYQLDGYSVITKNSHDKELLESLNLENLKYAIISLGDDIQNITQVFEIVKLIKKQKISSPTKFIVHIQSPELELLLHQKLSKLKSKIDIKTFSYYNECAVELFERSSLTGRTTNIIDTNKPYHIIITGDGELAYSIVINAIKIMALPNQNPLTINLIDKNALILKNKILSNHPKITDIKELKIVAIPLDSSSPEFFTHKVWKQRNLTNIYIADDSEEKNISLTLHIKDQIYLKEIVNKTLKPTIFTAVFDVDSVARSLKGFGIKVFGLSKNIINEKNLIQEECDKLAKMIHCKYSKKIDVCTKEKLDEEWYKLDFFKRESNKAQVRHIKTKLKAMHLRAIKSKKSTKELKKINNELFLQKFEKEIKQLEDLAKKHDGIYQINTDLKTNLLLEKLIISEHERWCNFHRLYGWSYGERNDNAKIHNCLIPLDKFEEKQKVTIQYDFQSIKNIPDYMAIIGMELIPLKKE